MPPFCGDKMTLPCRCRNSGRDKIIFLLSFKYVSFTLSGFSSQNSFTLFLSLQEHTICISRNHPASFLFGGRGVLVLSWCPAACSVHPAALSVRVCKWMYFHDSEHLPTVGIQLMLAACTLAKPIQSKCPEHASSTSHQRATEPNARKPRVLQRNHSRSRVHVSSPEPAGLQFAGSLVHEASWLCQNLQAFSMHTSFRWVKIMRKCICVLVLRWKDEKIHLICEIAGLWDTFFLGGVRTT